MAILCVRRRAVSLPVPGRPSVPATAATTGTARSAETVRTPSMPWRRAASVTAGTSVKSTGSATSASRRPRASGLRSTATTRRPSSLARRIARRWWRPAPTKSTLRTLGVVLYAARGEQESELVPASDFAAVLARERGVDCLAPKHAGDRRSLRAAVDLRAGCVWRRGREGVLQLGQPAARRFGIRNAATDRVALEEPRGGVGARLQPDVDAKQCLRHLRALFVLVAAARAERHGEGAQRDEPPHGADGTSLGS